MMPLRRPGLLAAAAVVLMLSACTGGSTKAESTTSAAQPTGSSATQTSAPTETSSAPTQASSAPSEASSAPESSASAAPTQSSASTKPTAGSSGTNGPGCAALTSEEVRKITGSPVTATQNLSQSQLWGCGYQTGGVRVLFQSMPTSVGGFASLKAQVLKNYSATATQAAVTVPGGTDGVYVRGKTTGGVAINGIIYQANARMWHVAANEGTPALTKNQLIALAEAARP